MTLNWVEEIVAQLYQLRGYLVIENEDMVLPKTENRRIQGHSDIDVLAIRSFEIVHVECQSWWGPSPGNEEKEFRRLVERFENAPLTIFKKYTFLDSDIFTIKKIFVTSGKPKSDKKDGPWARLQKECNRNDIDLIEINTIITKLIEELREKYLSKYKIGKITGISRAILHLAHNNFLKI